jgi:RNA-directed DNA polymerase
MINCVAAFGGEQVVHPYNLQRALRQVVVNKGSAGVDGMRTSEFTDYFREEKETTVSSIKEGDYLPQAILGVEPRNELMNSNKK